MGEMTKTPKLIEIADAMKRYCAKLESWNPRSRILPKGVTLGQCKADLATAKDALKPCGAEAKAVLLKRILQFSEDCDLKKWSDAKWDREKRRFGVFFDSTPEDLAEIAVSTVEQTERFPPKPEALYAVVRDEKQRRINMSIKLARAVHAREDVDYKSQTTPEERAEVSRIMRERFQNVFESGSGE